MVKPLEYRPVYRRNLPHYQPDGHTFFLTTRLQGSLPVPLVRQLQDQHNNQLRRLDQDHPEYHARRYKLQKQAFGEFDQHLDTANWGPTWLAQPEVATIVAGIMREHDGCLYDLVCYTIMSNHIHLVLTPARDEDGMPIPLQRIMYAIKRPAAIQANNQLGRNGRFWQRENYDHFIRDRAEYERIVAYVLNNPLKAGLCDEWEAWPWNYLRP